MYAASHTYRCTLLAYQLLHRVADLGSKGRCDPGVDTLCLDGCGSLVDAESREIFSWRKERTVLVFTNSAVENDFQDVSCGAVLVNASSGRIVCLVHQFLNAWLTTGKEQEDDKSFHR